jgi:phosphate uptake regulator
MRYEQTRRIQLTGRSSYIISIPKRWAEEIGLKPKDEVMIVRHGLSTIQIIPKQAIKQQQREATIHIISKEDVNSIIRKVISLYLRGYNVINIKAGKGRLEPELKKSVKDTVRRLLMGAEVTSDSIDNITLHVLLNVMELSIDNAFKRMLLLTKSMLKGVMLALKESNVELAKEIIADDDEVDRFYFYIIRQLNIAIENEYLLADMGLLRPTHCLDYRLIVKSIERVADHATNIAQQVIESNEIMDQVLVDKLIEASDKAISILDGVCLALFKMDPVEAEESIVKAKEFSIDVDLSSYRMSNSTLYKARFVMDNIKRIVEYASDIGELVLNITIDNMRSKGSIELVNK